MSGAFEGIVGVAAGRLSGLEGHSDRGWTIIDQLRDRLGELDVPVLAGLPFGSSPLFSSSLVGERDAGFFSGSNR